MDNRNKAVLDSFVEYCGQHPDLRFWQALRGWSGYGYILAANYDINIVSEIWRYTKDTFYWKGRNDGNLRAD